MQKDVLERITNLHTGNPWPLESVLSNVGPGWGKLVSELIEDLFVMGWDGKLAQVKEKFGGLRFYTSGTDEMHDRIDQAETRSLRTCETCGEPGYPDGWGKKWIKTLCNTHGAAERAANESP